MVRERRMGTRRLTALILALAGAALVAPQAMAEAPPGRLWTEKPQARGLDPDAPVSMRAFSKLAKQLSPTVVFINVRQNTRAVPLPIAQPTGFGTGFIIHPDGYVLTNNHVVEDAGEIKVKLNDDTAYVAEVVGRYAQLDVALLKVEADTPLPVAPLGSSEALEIGEWVIAIGNPFGLSHTVTAGIVSAKERRDVIGGREPMYARFIQTDASINPGNSGGPLINIHGEVIGINTAIRAGGQGIGFAVPIDMVKKILPQLATGHVARSYLGVKVGPVAAETANRLKLARPFGALVREVVPGTPAAKAGLQRGDVITRFNDKPIERWDDLLWHASTAGEGRFATMTVNRAGREVKLRAQMTHFPGEPSASARPITPPQPGPAVSSPTPAPAATAQPGVTWSKALGLGVQDVPDNISLALGLRQDEGVMVSAVEPRSVAEALGVRGGDVIVQVNYDAVSGVRGFLDAAEGIPQGEILSFTIRRDSRYLFKAITR